MLPASLIARTRAGPPGSLPRRWVRRGCCDNVTAGLNGYVPRLQHCLDGHAHAYEHEAAKRLLNVLEQ